VIIKVLSYLILSYLIIIVVADLFQPAYFKPKTAKFRYAIQVEDLVSDLAFDKFVRVCDQLETFFSIETGRRQVRAWLAFSCAS